MRKNLIASVLCMTSFTVMAQQSLENKPWSAVAGGMPTEWYATARASAIADTLLCYQTASGGWPKNVKWHREINHDEMRNIRETGIGATIDNGATTVEMRYLARVYAGTGELRFREAFLKGLAYILEAQYDNGGWPQFYPVRPQKSVRYSGHITYNDDAFLNVMLLLRDVCDDAPCFGALALPDSVKDNVRRAFGKGIDCILKTQIRVDGQPTVWCAQHDERTLQPAGARAYELASFSGAESAGLTLLLMELPEPSPEVVSAVEGAVKWFEDHKIADHKFVRVRDEMGKRNAALVPAEGECVWARFYDLDTGEPFFCDRDGIKRKSIEELGSERRNGYAWYVKSPAKVLAAYPRWSEKHNL